MRETASSAKLWAGNLVLTVSLHRATRVSDVLITVRAPGWAVPPAISRPSWCQYVITVGTARKVEVLSSARRLGRAGLAPDEDFGVALTVEELDGGPLPPLLDREGEA